MKLRMKIFIDGHCDTLERAVDEKLSIEDRKLKFNITDVKDINYER